ncbi:MULTISPECIES: dTDP-4-dehydrorhamnose 3,5-epimerase [Weeksella]|uniref:dTDP-4-dehydrorhamnose 3,5-epimerase n=1 Tax=Weeksella virosa (strain ATCC 43766 / DSM 16922 / JCM 21250 / CCUG 30538 / CDC 9751 / IAM 14551 / NBRC 16016 / NCTC 11634 / CL345/78) TaxID=865938 RepID=F0P2H4_WEEVC|nr:MULTISPECIES: dTDP-4-dehydrorhamnose 3,5-epimerase [Weeksella]ADX67813.1 dTDP-4-dehydrorhamnose 3,5-epimerase [Weeksella virosa DSM 16922]MDK7374102.1 dTDP-4-dehydrorhamnose 3,5-epimerase [Weeksella virosa]MDK7674414.1 dTDP-4-dehydrorhamnose 3,5-epimerase [Weeksella virosa]OFM82784.1 dTDP-4-dehydrorhamnose 3,5-epimerase [Weeksella sp. HMSC059D05]SUP54116.1 dTDP-4-dehydrorhamnose 3,5-epimerase [Weeksella virosa]
MNATETYLKGCFIIEPTVYQDKRGYFFESFNENILNEILGFRPHFVQDNQSQSTYGVVRGLHLQQGEHAQAKLVRVLEGKVLDVVVDVRKNSTTYGKSFSIELSSENNRQLFIPKGFLHGFSVLSERATFFYKCDQFYHKDSENGVYPLDIDLGIDWQIPTEDMILSEKDQAAQRFLDFNNHHHL